MANDNETQADILAEMRGNEFDDPHLDADGIIGARVLAKGWAARLEAALKREADSIHRAMVLIAGIEMESSEDPPRLWTALEDAYDALCDALGTDGDTTADEEEAKATGRHFVVKPSGNMAVMREAVVLALSLLDLKDGVPYKTISQKDIDFMKAALSAPPRNCDKFHDLKSAQRHYIEHGCPKGLGMLVDGEIRKFPWKSQFEKWLFAPATERKGEGDENE